MTPTAVSDLIIQIIKSEWAQEDDIVGCDDNEILVLEQTRKVKLPQVYKQFLKAMGHGAGTFEDNGLWTIRELGQAMSHSEDYIESLETPFRLSPSHFVFLKRGFGQEPEVYFFDTASGDDPPIYHFAHNEMDDGEAPTATLPTIIAPSFTQWLIDYAEEIEEIRSLTEEAE